MKTKKLKNMKTAMNIKRSLKMKMNVPYNLKKLGLIAMIAGASVACKKPKDETPEAVKHDTTYIFSNVSTLFTIDQVKASVDSSQVRYVYLVPVGGFENFSGKNISSMINVALKPTVAVSPKVKGKGNIVFKSGAAAQADSLWLTQQGWTVNQR